MTTDPRPTTFAIIRDHDITGISGTGHVADGVYWPDGSASVRWRGEHPSIVHWASAESVEAIHGHGGATRVVIDVPRVTPPDLDAVQRRVQTCLQAEVEVWDAQPTIEALWSSVQDVQPLIAEIARLRTSPAATSSTALAAVEAGAPPTRRVLREAAAAHGRSAHDHGMPGPREGAAVTTTDTTGYGPQSEHVTALIERAGRLTPDEAARLSAARAAVEDAAKAAAWDAEDAAWDADRAAARAAAWAAALAAKDAALDAARDAARPAARAAAWDAARHASKAAAAAHAAALALALRHLIGEAFTQTDYDTLTGPWREVCGPIHPDDEDPA